MPKVVKRKRHVTTLKRNALVSISSLPTELFALIFYFACRQSKRYPRQRFSQKETHEDEGQELVISHVCQSWRQICIACSDLWSSFNHFPKYAPEHLTHRLTTYLERAQQNTIDLWAHVTTVEVLQHVLHQLEVHSSRWRRVSLCFSPDSPTQGIGSFASALCRRPELPVGQRISYDKLELFDIHHRGPHWCPLEGDESLKYALLDGPIAPKLVSLRMDDGLMRLSRPLRARRTHLSVLQLSAEHTGLYFPWTTFTQIILNAPNLVSLTISGSMFQRSRRRPGEQIATVIAPKLRYFRCADPIVAKFMWHYIRAPQLELLMLKYTVLHHTDTLDFDTLQVADHFPVLRVLGFIECCFDLDEDTNCDTATFLARATQNISHLVIMHQFDSGIRQNESILHQMARIPSLLTLWPLLKTVSCLNESNLPSHRKTASFPDIMDFSKERRRLLGASPKYRMLGNLEQTWKQAKPDPKLWKYIDEEGLLEAMPMSTTPENEHYLPGDADPNWTRDAGFITQY